MSGRWPSVVAMLAVGACSSTGAPYREYEIRFDAPAPPSLDRSSSDGELIDAIAWLMRHRLDLPFPADIKAYVYVNEATFVEGLIKIGGEKIDDARDRGRFASGVATRVGVFLRGELTEFLGRFALDADPRVHWGTVFPISYRQFGDDFRARLDGLGQLTSPAGVGSPAASPPSSSR